MKIYSITTYHKTLEEYKVYKKEKAASKEAAYCLREQWRKECLASYLGSIIKNQ